ncbi:MAG: tetratricopeptide repeat protein [Muribaculaceae bacterium]|nr:tetratricopeptide repeat protein [Muribaculaceae bacterium]
MNNRIALKILSPLVLLLGFMPAIADNEAKSDYYFMEAMRQRSLGNDADAESLMERAFELNPDPASEIAKSVAFARIATAGNDTATFIDALSRIDRYVELNPNDSYAAVSLADYYARAGLIERALPLYARADSLNPTQPTLALRHARLLEMMRRPDDALEVYRRVEMREGKRTQLTYVISNLLLNQKNDTIGALAEVEALTSALPGDIEALTLAISANTAANRPDEAMRLAARAILLEPDNEPLHEFCIQTAYDLKGADAAFDAFAGALASDDLPEQDKSALLGFFVNGMKVNPTDEIIPVYYKATELFEQKFPENTSGMMLRARLALLERDFERAATELAHASALEPTVGILRSEQIRMLVLDNRPEQGIAIGEDALRTDGLTDITEVRLMLAGAYMNIKNYRAAAETLRPLIDDPDLDDETRAEIISTIADAEQFYRPAEEVAALYERAIALFPSYNLAKNNYAYMIAEKGGDLNRAEELITAVLNAGERRPIYLDTAAWVAYRLGKYGPAIGYMDEALALLRNEDPEAEFMLHAGDIYYRAGMSEKALEFWQKGLETDPESKDLRLRVELKRIPE